ncbi:substrate-binding domain-containing protein [Iningainema tapete]|uniref:DUF4912 domain-containing protein n=1 Tax=Iningainema tapete BLCC-T55 TaxID=2748662 RepID=A0A8J6XD89_9CYAN|nr:substrate-binding domain-containing protein [Iningainema tapete]MBD2770995.1 DUF4912 domain-containing protein [Iningainema tapete BLCC-T55]
MRQKEKKENSIVSVALLVTLATTPMAAILVSESTLAQSGDVNVTFPLPQTVPTGTVVRIDGSSSMALINQNLKQGFEKQFTGVKVEASANGTDAALKALHEGKIDIAAIARDLTPSEKQQGLEQIRLRREKIAIIVGEENPFKGSITDRQFARIFRGEITDWSEIGGPSGKIQFIDRPTSSDTRAAFSTYPVFKRRNFTTGSTANQLAEDSTQEVAKQLGKDGIGYVLANQVSKLEGVRVLPMNKILPDDDRYPFSQPFVYVYKKNPNPNIDSFLGFVTNSPGKQAVKVARDAETEAVVAVVSLATNPNSTSVLATPEVTTTASSDSKTTVSNRKTSSFLPNVRKNLTEKELIPILKWVLPMLALSGVLLWWLLGKRSKAGNVLVSNSNMPLQPALATGTNAPIDESNPQESHRVNQNSATPAKNSSQNKGGANTPLWLKFAHKKSDEIVVDETTSVTKDEVISTPTPVVQPSQEIEVASPVAPNPATRVVVVNNTSHPDASSVPPVNHAIAATSVDSKETSTGNAAILNGTGLSVGITPAFWSKFSDKPDGQVNNVVLENKALDIVADAAENIVEETASETVNTTNTPPVVEEKIQPKTNVESSVVLLPRSLKWAYAVWSVSDAQKEALKQRGGSQFTLRLYDVTDVDLSYQSPKLVQQYECEETIGDRYVAIPKGDRNYIAEIGYLTNGKRWLLLARSPIVRVLSRPDQDFYLITDAELIIHGATEPGATVSISGSQVKVQPDGTFHLRLPFQESLIDHTMSATSASGQAKTVRIKFSQDIAE